MFFIRFVSVTENEDSQKTFYVHYQLINIFKISFLQFIFIHLTVNSSAEKPNHEWERPSLLRNQMKKKIYCMEVTDLLHKNYSH